MHVVEREVEGLSCRALLAPPGWTARVHHDVFAGSSLNLVHFERLDVSGDSLYVAEYFIPRAAEHDESVLQKALQQRLIACVSDAAGSVQAPVCVVWKLEKPEGAASHASLAALLDQYTLFVCVVLWVADTVRGAMEEVANTIAADLRGRHMRILKAAVPEDAADGCGPTAVYTARGRAVVHVTQQAVGALRWNPTLCERVDRTLGMVQAELGLVSENLRLAVGGDTTAVVVALLPLSPGVSLLNPHAVARAWARHVKRGGWRSELLMRVNPAMPELALPSTPCWVTPRSEFYALSKDTSELDGVVAWVTEPRAGSDSCVVLLTPAFKSGLDVSDDPHPWQTQCTWLQRTFRVSIATAAAWTPLGIAKEPGLLFHEGGLVVRIPTASVAYTNATAVPTAAISLASLGSITVTAEDASLRLRRQVTFTLLNEFRCADDYIDYFVTEYQYDTPLGKNLDVFRRRRRQQLPPPVSPTIKRTFEKGEGHSVWIQLEEDAAVYCVARECGVGRLLLAQACVLGIAVDDAAAERWETWVSGVGVMAVTC
ncbi:hypothetical protein TraAM80_06349 [Trypanosoma rangeli]|uniref:Uncharacterized protein n=1 Tax=Trypanosoma rangeli TaxID=5698 RepID=A0A3R7KW35_TRYRA|nr:uncharacterized protein TraAM80_06349 [Trypanosoma rangeli]RNF02524.1 hypothetical protein TraAM80_06349 [Trypanosoma rangeli]|eukprot:RNF02524.1 hypothetical protein TraAM80_06349 [Trypanosoma rangeli]